MSIVVKHGFHYVLLATGDRGKDLEAIFAPIRTRFACIVRCAVPVVSERVAAVRVQPVDAKTHSKSKSSTNVCHAIKTVRVQSYSQDSLAFTPHRALQTPEMLVQMTKLVD